jgi:hypothetical protein
MILAATSWVLRLITAAMLALTAYVHADLAPVYDNNRDATLTQGDVFRIQAGLASFAALAVLVLAWRTLWSLLAWALAIVVAASALGAVLIYAHYDIGRLEPLPDMYEPLWYAEKRQAAFAAGIATGAAVLGFGLTAISARRAVSPDGPGHRPDARPGWLRRRTRPSARTPWPRRRAASRS